MQFAGESAVQNRRLQEIGKRRPLNVVAVTLVRAWTIRHCCLMTGEMKRHTSASGRHEAPTRTNETGLTQGRAACGFLCVPMRRVKRLENREYQTARRGCCWLRKIGRWRWGMLRIGADQVEMGSLLPKRTFVVSLSPFICTIYKSLFLNDSWRRR